MDRHKMLYKENSILQSPRRSLNRNLQNANRAKRREERIQSVRGFAISPTSNKNLPLNGISATSTPAVIVKPKHNLRRQPAFDFDNDDKENKSHESRIAKVACANDDAKLTRQEKFLKRFIEWKQNKVNKKAALEKNKHPFRSEIGIKTEISSFAPKGHQFSAPAGLKYPVIVETAIEHGNKQRNRRSIYDLVPNPTQKENANCVESACKNVLKEKPIITRPNKNINKNTATKNKHKTDVENKPKTMLRSVTKNALNKLLPPIATKPTTSQTSTKNLGAIPTVIVKKKPFMLPPPPPPPSLPRTKLSACKQSTALKKQPTKACTEVKTGPSSIFAKNVGKYNQCKPKKETLSVCMKAKKPVKCIIKSASIKRTFPNMKNKIVIPPASIEDCELVTPTNLISMDHFKGFTTSTQIRTTIKQQKKTDLNVVSKLLSPIAPLTNESNAQKEKLLSNSSEKKCKSKFNFLRYSLVDTTLDTEKQLGIIIEQDNVQTSENAPTISQNNERPLNYLSPFVSVSRGKVSAFKEKEKRNSIYLPYVLQSTEKGTNQNEKLVSTSDAASLEVRRTLEAVAYFRKQLEDEISRLHQLCDNWQMYKADFQSLLEQTCGDDMIDVTIGQTKLLTSKKFMQFKGLIDRCEACALGIGATDDGSEKTKPISAMDLEGFWSMLGLQIDNVNKRFENLERWKVNNWLDPDEIIIKAKNVTKMKKPKSNHINVASKAKRNSELQQMMRKMQAEMRKEKANTETESIAAANTPSRLSRVIVKDRKYRSVAPTILLISTPPNTGNSPLTMRQKSLNSSKNDKKKLINEQNELLKTVLICNETKKIMEYEKTPVKTTTTTATTMKTAQQLITPAKTETPNTANSACKSILKTPGTVNRTPKNVVFNENCRIKKFCFVVDSGDDEDYGEEELKLKLDPEQNDQGHGMYKLRSRIVAKRPSCEIEIPKMK